MATQLILLADIITLKPISINTNETKKVNPYIMEAQEFDLKPCLGDEFYISVLAQKDDNWSDPNYSDLWNGKQYTYNNKEYVFQGMKAALIYWSYARIITNIGQDETAFGVMQKLNDYSQQIDGKQLAMKVKQTLSGAANFKNDFIDFLNRNKELFPIWKENSCCDESKGSGTYRSRRIGHD